MPGRSTKMIWSIISLPLALYITPSGLSPTRHLINIINRFKLFAADCVLNCININMACIKTRSGKMVLNKQVCTCWLSLYTKNIFTKLIAKCIVGYFKWFLIIYLPIKLISSCNLIQLVVAFYTSNFWNMVVLNIQLC